MSAPMLIGRSNYIPTATLTCSPTPDTPIDNLKTEWATKPTRWTDLSEDIEIDFEFPGAAYIDYFAIPSLSLLGDATVRLELYDGVGSTTDIVNMSAERVGKQKPLGEWRAGVDPYGNPTTLEVPKTYLHWFDETVICNGGKLIIDHAGEGGAAEDVQLRMFLIGEKFRFQRDFDRGNSLSMLTPPELVQMSSGSWVPSRYQRPSRVLNIPHDYMTDYDRMVLSRVEVALNGQPFIVSAYPQGKAWQFDDYSFLARFANSVNYKHQYVNVHEASNLIFVEV